MSSGKAISENAWHNYFVARQSGVTKREAARRSGIAYSTVMAAERDPSYGKNYQRAYRAFKRDNPDPAKTFDQLSDEAKRALEDFAYFRLRYFGRYSTPWQVHAAEMVVAKLATSEKEYGVINVAPGSGKSTLFTHDIPAWLIARNRNVRIMIGSATERVAKAYGGRLRRTLERSVPLQNPVEEVEAGRMAHAEATMVADFGRFKPPERDLWRAEEFVVESATGEKADDKEATVATYGRDGGFLGGRFNFVVWDDLVTRKTLRTVESREELAKWYDDEAETRLEPGGLFLLQGQRLHANDLYRHALDLTDVAMDDDGNETDTAEPPRKYFHIVYAAHFPQHCKPGSHRRDAPAYDPANPDGSGCLLDPRRLSWKELVRRQNNNLESFLVVYQQEDVDPARVLVDRLWVSGGRNAETGEEHPGCWDKERTVWQVPSALSRPYIPIVGVDPSGAKWWSVQLWLMHPASEFRFLIEHKRAVMRAEDFLTYDPLRQDYAGLLEEWWVRAKAIGIPFQWVIVEQNAAQRYLLHHPFVRQWCTMRGVTIIGHDTHGQNKADPTYGVQELAKLWKLGRVKLPSGDSESRGKSMALVDEVTKWPEGQTDDCVMAHWFVEYRWQKHLKASATPRDAPVGFKRPSWMRRSV